MPNLNPGWVVVDNTEAILSALRWIHDNEKDGAASYADFFAQGHKTPLPVGSVDVHVPAGATNHRGVTISLTQAGYFIVRLANLVN